MKYRSEAGDGPVHECAVRLIDHFIDIPWPHITVSRIASIGARFGLDADRAIAWFEQPQEELDGLTGKAFLRAYAPDAERIRCQFAGYDENTDHEQIGALFRELWHVYGFEKGARDTVALLGNLPEVTGLLRDLESTDRAVVKRAGKELIGLSHPRVLGDRYVAGPGMADWAELIESLAKLARKKMNRKPTWKRP